MTGEEVPSCSEKNLFSFQSRMAEDFRKNKESQTFSYQTSVSKISCSGNGQREWAMAKERDQCINLGGGGEGKQKI